MKPGKPVHPVNGIGVAPDAATTPGGTEISFDAGPNRVARSAVLYVVVSNLETTQTLELSFSSGQDGMWFSVAPSTTILFPVNVFRMSVRGAAGGTAAYSVLGIV